LAEDVAWRDYIESLLLGAPDNVLGMWHYGFTEFFNYAIDHSAESEVSAHMEKTDASIE